MRKFKIVIFNGIVITISSLVMQSVGSYFMIYISNKIGSETLGIFNIIMSIYMFFITLATSGINIATTQIVIKEKNNNYNCSTILAMKKCIFYSLFFGILSCILLFIFSPYISNTFLHNKISYKILYVVAVSLPFISVSSSINGYFNAIRKNIKNVTTKIFEQIIKIICTLYILYLFLPKGIDYICLSLVLGETICEMCSCILSVILYLLEEKKYIYYNNKKLKRDYLKSILKISIPISITSYIRSILSTLKQVLIPLRLEKSGLSYETSLSQYGLINGMALNVLMFPSIIINSFSTLLLPEFSYYSNQKLYKSINAVISKVFKLTFIFSIGFMGFFLFYSEKISSLFFNNENVAFYLKILSPLVIPMYLDNVVDNILKGLNKQLGVMKCNILDLFISIGGIFILLPLLGINGYILITYISILLNSSISIFQLRKCTNFDFDFINWIIKPIIVMFIIYMLLSILVPNIIIQLCLYLCFYFIYSCFNFKLYNIF